MLPQLPQQFECGYLHLERDFFFNRYECSYAKKCPWHAFFENQLLAVGGSGRSLPKDPSPSATYERSFWWLHVYQWASRLWYGRRLASVVTKKNMYMHNNGHKVLHLKLLTILVWYLPCKLCEQERWACTCGHALQTVADFPIQFV